MPRAIRMNLDDSRIQRESFDLNAHDLLHLQVLEDPIQHSVLRPAIQSHIYAVPVAKMPWERAPLGAVFGNVQQSVQHIQHIKIGQPYISALHRQLSLIFAYRGERAATVRFGRFERPSKPNSQFVLVSFAFLFWLRHNISRCLLTGTLPFSERSAPDFVSTSSREAESYSWGRFHWGRSPPCHNARSSRKNTLIPASADRRDQLH